MKHWYRLNYEVKQTIAVMGNKDASDITHYRSINDGEKYMYDSNNFEKNNENSIHNKLALVSFACSILIIYYHAFNLQTYDIKIQNGGVYAIVYAIESYCSRITEIAVPVFYFISGLLFFRNFKIIDLLSKWKKRVHSIFIPYVIWCTVYYLYYVICTNIPVLGALTKSDKVVLSFGQLFNWIFVNEYYTLWFLKNLILYVLLAPVIWGLLKNHKENLESGIVVLVIVMLFLKSGIIDSIFIDGLEYYLVGAWIGINHKQWLEYRNRTVSIVLSIILIVIHIYLCFFGWKYITKITYILAMWFAIDLMKLEDVIFPWWTEITFFTYVAHDMFLEALEKLFFVVFGNGPFFALVDYLFMPIAVFIVLVAVAYIGKKRFSVLWRIACGGR